MGSNSAAPVAAVEPVSMRSSAFSGRGGFIYQIVNKVTGESYIYGTTIATPERRWKAHVCAALFGRRDIDRAIRRYGPEAFELRVLMVCPTKHSLRLHLAEYYTEVRRPDVCQLPKSVTAPILVHALPGQPTEILPDHLRCRYRLPWGYENKHLLGLQRKRLMMLLRRYPQVKEGLGQVLSITQLAYCWGVQPPDVLRMLERLAKRSQGQVVMTRGYDDGAGNLVFERPWWQDYLPRDDRVKVVRIYVGPGPEEVPA